MGWSGTIIVTDGTRGRARTGAGVSELSLPHRAEYKRTHGHLLSDILAALGSTGVFFFPKQLFLNHVTSVFLPKWFVNICTP